MATSAAELHELAQMKAPSWRVSVVPCGVNTDIFTPGAPRECKSWRKRMIVVGHLVRRKGVDEVVQALKWLPTAELVIVGGSGDPDPDADRIRALAKAEGVSHRIELRGSLPNAEIPRVLRSADLVVCFPWYEPFGIVAVEAMACGTPVLMLNRGAAAEIIQDGRTGFVVEDEASLISAIDRLGRIDRSVCREHAALRFDHRHMAAGYERLALKARNHHELFGR